MNRRDYGRLSVSLKNEIGNQQFKKLKTFLKNVGDFGEGELERMEDVLDIWNALDRSGRIAPGKLNYLIESFDDIQAYNLTRLVKGALGLKVVESDAMLVAHGVKTTRFTAPQQPEDEMKMKPAYKYFKDPVYDFKDLNQKMKNRGIMLIINQFKEQREGTLQDVEALKVLFETHLGFHVELRHDQTKSKVLAALQDKVMMMKDNEVERFFCVILSHGNEKGIWCVNSFGRQEKQVSLEEEILPMFRADKLPQMKDRPKVFIVQACRGLEYHKGVTVSDADTYEKPPKPVETPPDDNPGPLFTPNEADFLVAYPQTEGYRSFRDTCSGSWFIQELVQVFTACYKEHDLVSMLTEVNNQVSQKFTTKTGHEYLLDQTPDLQMPCYMSSLRKKMYLSDIPAHY